MRLDSEEIIKAYTEGESLNSIANRLHTYPTSVCRVLKRNKIKLRHDAKREGTLYVKNGEELIEWARAQGRLVTRAELAKVVKKKKLSPSYFIKYPELGQYVQPDMQTDLQTYYQQLYNWLQTNSIPYKPNDRTKLKVSVDALLLEDYSNIAICISEKPKHISKKQYDYNRRLKIKRAREYGITIVFLNKEHFEDLDKIKPLLDSLKSKEN